MNWKKLLLYPLAIYGVIYLFICVLIGLKMDQHQTWVWIAGLVISIVGLFVATKYAKPKNIREGIIYGLVWLVVFFVLDLILTVPFTGWGYFGWKSYVSYGITVLIPTLLPKK
jgi:hypothetical protein